VYIGSRDGKVVAKSPGYFDWWGLAWAPGGQEVWFSVVDTEGVQCAVYAMDLHGRVRPLYRAPGALTLHDVSADGRILASFDQVRFPIEARAVGANASGDLSWKEGGSVDDVADNGAVLFTASGDSAGPRGSVYIRRPGESEPIRIADGGGRSLSRDGKTAVVVDIKPLRLLLVPAEGLPQPMDIGSLDTVGVVESLPDGRLIIELSRTPGEKPAVFIRPKDGGPVAPLLPANMHLVGARLVSPDSSASLLSMKPASISCVPCRLPVKAAALHSRA
jgi:hypothetical protein